MTEPVHNGESQQQLPLALVRGQPFFDLPQDLYIPPDALEVILESFEGPLDLLLYLIRRQNLDILDIPVARVAQQYIGYVELMQELRLDLAAEYLVMAAILAEIKSRLLLPRSSEAEQDEEDPRAELVRRLQEYERFKKAAEDLDALPRMDRDLFGVAADFPDRQRIEIPPEVDLRELLLAFKDVLRRSDLTAEHFVRREPLSIRQRMGEILHALGDGQFHRFEEICQPEQGRRGVVVSFMALLELVKAALLEIVQERPLAPIFLKSLA
ncbi:MAG: segregation/condensation protein A [Xanthomonadales bacterium]|nr:segregation/condensation protein A [Xanthomonadales bacterium]